MAGHASAVDGLTSRERVRFYLVDHQTVAGKTVDVALLSLILVFIALFIVETYAFAEPYLPILFQLEVAISFVFLGEYLLRLYSARNRLAEALNPYTIVDLLAIAPTLLIFLFPTVELVALNVGFLRVLRVMRALRFYRFTADEEFFFGTVSLSTLRAMKLALTVVTIFFVTAGLFYSFEHHLNPTVNNFGDAFYFVVVTLTTVGFGDITPVTNAGRWVTVSAIIIGIIIIPWQASRIVKEWTYKERVNVTCENCGLAYHDKDASHCKACGHVIYQQYDSRE
ncbi:ion transporter [Haladaptatus sp. DJG-WS-42]|uniref:ion transporter n=1 Tax=Haladaptatus sp. DJG-WS-42 TaxID=3120516 RepID=UPI0030D2F5F5